jgi:ATP-dependent Clp protease protease subunit
MTKDIISDDDMGDNPGLELQKNGIYVFMDEVNQTSIKPVIEWILYENYVVKNKKRELLLMICSEGGELPSAFALIDTMNNSTIPIKTVGLGEISSCGLLIFMSGTRGRRVITPNTSILSHQYSWYNEGKMHELFATVREYELTQIRMTEHYKRCTGLDENKIREFLLPSQDRWLSHEEAIELNICDSVSANPSTDSVTRTTRKTKNT